jgi:hypothetical protein
MAQSGATINMLSNVRAAVSGVEDVADAVEDVEGRLHDLTKEGSTATDRMESDFRSVAKSADRASDELKTKFRDAYQSVRRNSDQAADDAVKSQRRISERSAEVGQEVRQNLGEGIANAARGDFAALADTIGDTFGGAVAGIGGIATAGVAAAGAIGVGALIAALSSVEERTTAARERAIELAQVMYQNKGSVPLADRIQELITTLGSERLAQNPFEQIGRDFVDLGTNIDAAKTAAREADVPIGRLMKGLTGSDIRTTKDALESVNDELERMNQESGNVNLESYGARKTALEAMRGELEKIVEQQELAGELADSTEFINAGQIEAQAERSKVALDSLKGRLDELSQKWQGAATDASDYFAETEEGATEFDWGSYLADAEATVAAADEMKSRLVGLPSDIRAEAERIFASQGAVAANEYTKAYESASEADKGRFVSAAAANGDAAGRAQAASLKAAFGTPVVNARVAFDSSSFDSAIARMQRRADQGITVNTRILNGRLWD